mmetsp:Transcript_7111/g.22811  ORF Transcript_7111/g.22811 Transcript_7111/m.22811 type:complete len:281 (+) Transcript_7111:805-1647(+)
MTPRTATVASMLCSTAPSSSRSWPAGARACTTPHSRSASSSFLWTRAPTRFTSCSSWISLLSTQGRTSGWSSLPLNCRKQPRCPGLSSRRPSRCAALVASLRPSAQRRPQFERTQAPLSRLLARLTRRAPTFATRLSSLRWPRPAPWPPLRRLLQHSIESTTSLPRVGSGCTQALSDPRALRSSGWRFKPPTWTMALPTPRFGTARTALRTRSNRSIQFMRATPKSDSLNSSMTRAQPISWTELRMTIHSAPLVRAKPQRPRSHQTSTSTTTSSTFSCRP